MVAQVHDTLFVERRKHYIPEITILADADAVFFIHSGEFSAKLLISRILYPGNICFIWKFGHTLMQRLGWCVTY